MVRVVKGPFTLAISLTIAIAIFRTIIILSMERITITTQWRIQDFPGGRGHQLPKWDYFLNFLPKIP